MLTAGHYVGGVQEENDGVPFALKMQELTALLNEQFKQRAGIGTANRRGNLKGLGYGI